MQASFKKLIDQLCVLQYCAIQCHGYVNCFVLVPSPETIHEAKEITPGYIMGFEKNLGVSLTSSIYTAKSQEKFKIANIQMEKQTEAT